ncbi:MAG: tetratricopeptide repeat protein [Candidatus Omnitrophota bacterium]
MNFAQWKKAVWRRDVLLGVLVFFATGLVYWKAVGAGYIWDDDYWVTGNPILRDPGGILKLWIPLKYLFQYYPVVLSTLWLEFQIWGANPMGYHIVNILLHAANAVLVWRILRYLKVPGAFWAGLIFAVHPIQVESVAWITEIKNVMSGFFYLLALRTYLSLYDFDRKVYCHEPRRFVLAVLFFVLALLSKTVTCSFPAAVLLIVWWKTGRIRKKDIKPLFPVFAAGFVLGLLTVWIEKHEIGAQGTDWHLSLLEHFLLAGRILWFYIGKIIWPQELLFFYSRWQISDQTWWQYLFPLGFLLLLAVLYARRKSWGRGPLTAVLFYALTLFPALGFFNVYPMRFSFVADHFQYLAGLGIIALLTVSIVYAAQTLCPKSFRYVPAAVMLAIVALLGIKTSAQTEVYQNAWTLYSYVIEKNPQSWIAYNNRGSQYFDRGLYKLADQDFRRALSLKPDYADALNNRGLVFYKKGQEQQALKYFSAAIEAFPEFSSAITNRATVYRELGDYQKALEEFNRSIEINPDYYKSFNRRGILFMEIGEYDKAVEDFSRAIDLAPQATLYYHRFQAYKKLKQWLPALKDLNHLIYLDPQNVQAYKERAVLYFRQGRLEWALNDIARIRELGGEISPELVRQIRRMSEQEGRR